MKRLVKVIKKFISPQSNLFRYSLSFCLLLALLPALIVILKVFQSDLLDANKLASLLYGYVPKILLEPFIEYVLSQEYTTFISLIVSSVFSIYLASNAFYSFMLISMTDEKFETYSILIRIKAIMLFVLLVLGIVALAFFNYLMLFSKNVIIYEVDKSTNDLSDKLSDDLKKRGMKFVGSTIIYSFLQSIGIIYSHDKDCFLYSKKSNVKEVTYDSSIGNNKASKN